MVLVIMRHISLSIILEDTNVSHVANTNLNQTPLVKKHTNVSTMTKHSILQSIKQPNRTFTDVAHQHHVSIQSVINIFDKAVDAPRLKLKGQPICMDEVFISKKKKSPYACVLYDFDSKQIIDVHTHPT